jgi:hypothetical protein
MMPPTPPMNTTPIQKSVEYTPEVPDDGDDISDIVSEGGAVDEGDDEVKEVKMPAAKAKRGRKKKVEINL